MKTASVKYEPTCGECGKRIFGTIDCIPIISEKALNPVDYEIVPNRCPYCDAIFESISIPTNLPYYSELRSD